MKEWIRTRILKISSFGLALSLLLAVALPVVSADRGKSADTEDTAASITTAVANLKRRMDAELTDFTVVSPPRGVLIARYGEEFFSVRLPEAGCYRVISVGDAPGRDINLDLLSGGKSVAADRTSGDQPIVDWCAPAALDVQVHLSVYSSDSACAFAVLKRKSGASADELVAGGKENDLIANRIRQLVSLKVPSVRVLSGVHRGNLLSAGVQAFEVTLDKGVCPIAIAVPEPSMRKVQVALLSVDGTVLMENAGPGFALATGPCTKVAGVHRVRVTAVDGSGQFGVQLFAPAAK